MTDSTAGAPPASRPTRPGPLWAIVAGVTGLLAIRLVASVVYVAGLVAAGLPTRVYLVLLKPGVLAAAAALVLLIATWHARSRSWRTAALVVGALAVVVGVTIHSPWSGIDRTRLTLVAVAAGAGLLLWPLATGLWGRLRFGVPLFWVALLAALVGYAAVRAGYGKADVNRYGLVSFPPNSENTFDYAGHTNKDNYPPCHFTYNSLGYRDVEPDPASTAPERVLLVGDSFVWGDGIPTAEDTLGVRLREALAAIAPGRFDVVSAAFPGMNLFGYVRTAVALQPELEATIVVIGYLGSSDHGLLDAQALVEGQPEGDLARRVLVNLGIRQDVHEAGSQMGPLFAANEVVDAFVARQFERLRTHAAANGYRVVVLRYDGRHDPPPAGFETIELPDEWRYPGHSTPLWYAKDNHPKPALNRLLGEHVARALVASTPSE